MNPEAPSIVATLRERVLTELLHAALDVAYCTNVECDHLHERCERLQAELHVLQRERSIRNGNG